MSPPAPSSSGKTGPAWDDALLANPHAVADKRRRVRQMFAAIAPSYDLNNRLHSLWQDQRWRKKAVEFAHLKPTDVVIDVACGTGDLTHGFAKHLDTTTVAHFNRWSRKVDRREIPENDLIRTQTPLGGKGMILYPNSPHVLRHPQVLGVDFTFDMLPLAIRKTDTRHFKPSVRFVNADAQFLPLPDQSADVVSIAFGIRNVQDPAAAVREFYRILRPGGRVIILEFSLPTSRPLRAMYNFYFRHVLPRTATLISGDKTGAYKYLPESVNTFIGREQMTALLRDGGFEQVEQFPMTFGVCVCYRGIKNG
jgi:demethylmenaquinone methyltransferase/2-methoxy-6-polyprenyl-1,4-benzoquinol methylase